MASNYSSDPKNAAAFGNLLTPQGSSGGKDQVAPYSAQSSQPTPPSAGSSHGGQRRLPAGIELSSGRYKIERSVAAGGMGAVYRALDIRFSRPCAVKEMLDDFQNDADRGQALEWFKREATLLLELNHPCIPRVRDFFVEDGRHYLVMDFIEGRTLGEVLEREGNIAGVNGARGVSEARARSWAQQVCSVLSYLHRQVPPIIFRDLKPSNIMVTDKDEIKLIDFGIARTFQSQRQSTIIMTIGYAPPEQLHGRPEPRSDLYALGATLHRVLTHHDAANNKASIFSFPPVRSLRPDISPAFEQVIARALAPNLEALTPNQEVRWASAAEMERAVINLPPASAQPAPLPPTILGGGSERLTPQQPVSAPRPAGTGGFTGPAGVLLRQAQEHLNGGRIQPAWDILQQAFALEPNNSFVHKMYGQVFARRQPPQAEMAINAYNRSLQLNNNDAETHRLVGDVYLYVRHLPAQAILPYTQALRLNPQDFEAHRGLAKSYEETGQIPAALQAFQEAARVDAKRPDIHYSIGQLALRLNQLTVAEHAFVLVLTINPADHATRFVLAQIYERESKWEDAWRECVFVVNANPANGHAQEMLQRLRAILRR
ncbi:MAG TPA: serine/threonine-protein kinase [Ktedonobacteraceae bacterium]|nr:serine/threonine-protein kinase [Ktedonobacteraceae bacterium]